MRNLSVQAVVLAITMAAAALEFSSQANAQPYGWGVMGGWGGYGPLNMIIWLLILGLVIAGIVWFVRAMTQRATPRPLRRGVRRVSRSSRSAMPAARSTATNICKRGATSSAERYSRRLVIARSRSVTHAG